ncbi:MAG: MFS family permease [Verrucomicrobiales bacterium]
MSPTRTWNPLEGRPLVTAVVFVAIGVMPLYLTSAQVISLDAALGFDAARLGIGTAVYFGLAAVVAQPVAAIVTRIGAQRGLQVGAFFSLIGSVAAATAVSWLAFLVAVGCAGLANAFMQVSTNIVLARGAAFRRQGLSFGAKQGAVPLASAVAGILLPSVGVALGWRWPYVLAIVLAFVVMFFAPEVDDRAANREQRGDGDRPPLSISLKLLALGGACGGAAGNAVSLFLVPAAVDIGTTEAAAGAILAVGSALVFLLRVGVGAFADRAGSTGHLEMTVILILGAIASFGLAFVSSTAVFVVVMPLALLGSWGWPGLIYFTVVRIHPEATARASGVILASNLTGTLIGPSIVSQLADRGAYKAAWLFVAALGVASAVFIAASGLAFRKSSNQTAVPSISQL